jgi:hypothetical protein
LHDPDVAYRKLLKHDASVFDRREVVSSDPIPRSVLFAPIELVGLEGFKFNCQVTEIIEAQRVEIVLPDPDVEVLTPIIAYALVDD